MKTVKLILFNWHQAGSVMDSAGSGENYDKFEVGSKEVCSIIENEPHNGMQLWNYEVILNNGISYRIFNPNFVEYFKTEDDS